MCLGQPALEMAGMIFRVHVNIKYMHAHISLHALNTHACTNAHTHARAHTRNVLELAGLLGSNSRLMMRHICVSRRGLVKLSRRSRPDLLAKKRQLGCNSNLDPSRSEKRQTV